MPFGTPVTYCYTVTNTGAVALDFHTLVDDQLGTVLDNFFYALAPGASVFVTVDDVVLDRNDDQQRHLDRLGDLVLHQRLQHPGGWRFRTAIRPESTTPSSSPPGPT